MDRGALAAAAGDVDQRSTVVGYDGFGENQYPQLNYKRYLMLMVENGRIRKREFQDRKLWDR